MLATTILISKESLSSEDSYDVVASNVDSVNALLERLVEYEEITPEALKSYYVDYYLAQVQNGGFSQFIYNIGCDGEIIEYVRQGLTDMQAREHAALLEKSLSIIDGFSEEQLDAFLESEFFGENAERDQLNAFNDEFRTLNEREDLVEHNSRWLKQHPQLQPVSEEALDEHFDEIAAKIPDFEERARQAMEDMPRYAKVIDELCEVADHELDRITAGDPSHEYQGKAVLAWHFLTDKGHFYMIDLGDKALMLDAETHEQIAEADVSHLNAEDD